ncbi:MAG TPA: response regulator [Polyangiaceae bacterium]|jgi:CheY-like chemotaxis protein|nr:response regulator [Polyangiaceae bacterium]
MAEKKSPVVLVADDEPSMLALVAAFVRSKGYTVIEASDGDMAWQLACDHLPDLIILDVMMPGMSGWEVCRKVREAVSLAHTGVIMLTGIGESLNEMTSPLYGADAYVDKPFEFGDLERNIVETLKKRRGGALGRADQSSPPTAESVVHRATIRSPAFDIPISEKIPVEGKATKASKSKAAKPKKPAPKKPAPKKTKPVKAAKKAPAKKAPAKSKPKAKAAKRPAKALKKKAAKKAPAKKAAAKKSKPARKKR